MLHNWRTNEGLLALKTPVMEAEYAIDERTALSLYDSIKPRVKEQVRLLKNPNKIKTIADYNTILSARQFKWNL